MHLIKAVLAGLLMVFATGFQEIEDIYPTGDCNEQYEYGHYKLWGEYNNLAWKFDVSVGEENNWAEWGPPPPGWTNRRDIPHIENEDGTWTYLENANPWPPAAPYEGDQHPISTVYDCLLDAAGTTYLGPIVETEE